MTEQELDAFLILAKPRPLSSGEVAWQRAGFPPEAVIPGGEMPYHNKPRGLFFYLQGGRFDMFHMIYPDVAAARAALADAVARYRVDQNSPPAPGPAR